MERNNFVLKEYSKIVYRNSTYYVSDEILMGIFDNDKSYIINNIFGEENCTYGNCFECYYKPDKDFIWIFDNPGFSRCVVTDKIIKDSLEKGYFDEFIMH